MPRWKDATINLPEKNRDGTRSWESIYVGLLLDIRDEMKINNEKLDRLVDVLECRNTATIPHTLNRIDRRLAKKIPLK